MRVVFDTVIIVRGLINPYGPRGRLMFDWANDFQHIVAPPIVAEYLDVLRRPELTRKFRNVATRDPHAMLAWLAQAEVVELDDVPAISRDPKDDPFLATAVAGAADYLVSEDLDLLDLVSHAGIPIVTGARFLAILDSVAWSP